MPQYGRISRTFLDSQGRPISGLNVTVRKQGATVNGLHAGTQTSFTVNDPGGITSSPQDQLQVGTDTSVTRAVSSVAATTIVVGAAFTDVPDDARLTPTTNLPTVYNDAQAAETITQPLVTDANGEIVCWAPVVPYDLYTPGNASYAARLIQDVVPEGQEYVVSNIFPSATSVAFRKDTARAQVFNSKMESWLSGGVEKFYIGLSAGLTPVLPGFAAVGSISASGAITSGGNLNSGDDVVAQNDIFALAGDIEATAGVLRFGAAASRIVPGATSLALRNHANNADNVLISDAGAMTIRAGLTATGNSVITGSLSGVTSLSLEAIIGASTPTLTVNSATPSVSGGRVFAENNTVPTNITDFTPHNHQQEITIIINTTNTTFVDGATLQMNGGVNFNPNANDVLKFVQWLGTWYEVSRSPN